MKVVLKHAKKWLCFEQPERVLRTDRIDEVLPLLREAEASGLFAVGWVSYEASSAFDTALTTQDAEKFPLLCLGLFSAPDVLDSIEEPPDAAYQLGALEPSVSKEQFMESIAQIKEQIAAGATYQVNYTYRLAANFSGDAWALFYELTRAQPTAYAAFIETDDFAVCSASPELFFQCNGEQILARPMKGTARRGRTMEEDWRLADALQASEKDRAENIMIVDMIRNDIGRVAVLGSVETVRTFEVEKYPTVWQMTSTVKGLLAPVRGINLAAIFQALFPCASITGAPKAKTMELIRTLECGPRKIYTGAIGFMTPSGEGCFSVAIRTALIDRMAGQLEYGVGGGVVWDSDAEAEYEETLNKAQLMTRQRKPFDLLETLLWEPETGFFLLDRHLKRLGKTAAYFDVPLDLYEIQAELERVGQGVEPKPHRVRLLVHADGSFEVQTFLLEDDQGDAPTKIMLAQTPVDAQDPFLFHKTTHRSVYEQAAATVPEEGSEVILWNQQGEVTESAIANVVIRKEGRLITPPVTCGLLAGTFREALVQRGDVEEAGITVEDLQRADEIWLINSVRRWRKAIF